MYTCGSKPRNSYTTNLVDKISDQLLVSAYIGLILSVIGILVKSCIGEPPISGKKYMLDYIKVVQSLC